MSKETTIPISISVQQFAATFQVSAATVRKMIHSQKIQGYRVGHQWRIPVTETHKFLGTYNEED